MIVDIVKLDRDIKFLRDEAKSLRDRQGNAPWALTKSNRFDEIADQLVEVRRDKQMTGMDGRRIDER